MSMKLGRLFIVVVFILLVFGLSSTGKVAWAADPAMTSPTPGSTLTTTTINFQWSPGTGVDKYYLGVGTTPGSVSSSPWGDIFHGEVMPPVDVTIPINGNKVYIRL